MKTAYAPAERLENSRIQAMARKLAAVPLFDQLLRSVPELILVLEEHRQVVYANRAFLAYLEVEDISELLGKRPGEIVHCIHASETEGGCGTTRFCRTCGAVNAILRAMGGQDAVEECRIIQKNGGSALDFRVWSTRLVVAEMPLTIFAVRDITDEKRRRVLERMFFHDLLNTAGAMKTALDIVNVSACDGAENRELLLAVRESAGNLLEEIESQRALAAAENGSLEVSWHAVQTLELLRNVVRLMQSHEVAAGRTLRIDPEAVNVSIKSDSALLKRVLVNMTKNALEATPSGGTVTLGCRSLSESGEVEFWVHNSGVIPDDVQLQIFQRSFSTKGAGRGIGTHSMKLLTERYLHGRIEFTSTAEEGTVFRARYPVDPHG